MRIKGKEFRNVEVEVNPLHVVDELWQEAFQSLKKTEATGINYDYSSFIIEEDNKIIEIYIKEGYSYGHYDKEDKIVYRIDRSHTYGKDFREYIVSLDKVRRYLRSKL